MLYGTAQNGGTNAEGTVFKLTTNGTSFSTLYNFSAVDGNGFNPDGALPVAGFILSGNTLYGTASAGGATGDGTLFKLGTNGANFNIIYSFTALDPTTQTNLDGATPLASLLLSGSTLYGTASQGGSNADGTVFYVNTNGSNFSTLYSFTGSNDGAAPASSLLLSGNVLYGTASQGGAAGNGTIFQLNTSGSGFSTLYSFSDLDLDAQTNSDGAGPVANLILSSNILYGTAYAGGPSGYGTIFEINTNGSGFISLLSFDADNNGANPAGGLALSNNILYGTTQSGGSGGDGTIFAVNLLEAVPIRLYIQRVGTNVVLTWSNPIFGLQAAPNAQTNYFTNVPGATSPYTNAITAKPQFFRLRAGQ